jgi:2-desacetyl-2-hydroxyethyl bacteriochlorophyllide A dehydrogenase
MRAVVCAGDGRVEVKDVAPPHPENPGDAIVRVRLSSICGSDLHLLSGKTPGMRAGAIIGHEFVGKVEEASPDVDDLLHRRVLGSFLIACGKCAMCSRGNFNFCRNRRALGLGELTGDLDGAQAEFVRVPTARVNLLPLVGAFGKLDDERSLFAGDILATAFHATSLAEAGPDHTALVFGAGPVGLLCAVALKSEGAGRVIIADAEPGRVAWATGNLGLEAVDVSETPAKDALSDLTGGRLADVAIDAVGAVPVVKSAMRCVGDGGRVVVLGVYGAERMELAMGRAWVRGLDLRFAGMANVQGQWRHALEVVAGSSLDPTRLITHRLPLEDAVTGYELFRSRQALKVVLRP